MNIFARIGHGIWKALKWEGKAQLDAVINIDRAIDSEAGAPVDYTISGELGKHKSNPLAAPLADALDAIQPGHVENAERTDEALAETRAKIEGGT